MVCDYQKYKMIQSYFESKIVTGFPPKLMALIIIFCVVLFKKTIH